MANSHWRDAAEPPAERVEFRDVAAILRRRISVVVGAPLALLAVSLVYVATAHPSYTATAQVFVDPRDRRTPKDDPNPNSVPGDGLLLVESQLKIITSDKVLSRVVDTVGLDHDSEFDGERTGLLGALKSVIGLEPAADRRLVALRNLRLKTATKRNEKSFVIDIMASADTRERAVKIANALAAAYLQEQPGADADFNRQLSDTIAGQLERLRGAVTDSENAVAAYKANNNLVGSGARLVTEQQLDEANTQLTNAKSRLAEAQARVRQIDAVSTQGSLETLPEAVQSGTIAQLRGRAADVSRELSQLETTLGPLHPALLAARAQKRDIEAAVLREVARVAQALRVAAASAKRNVDTLQAQFETLKAQAETNDKLLVPLRELERTASANRATYEAFLAKAKTAKQQEGLDLSNIRLITDATPPERQSWPPTALMLGVAAFGGLALGVALALGMDQLSSSRGPRPRGREGLTALAARLRQEPTGHTILFVRAASGGPAESNAFHVAKELADAGENVLLIDADLKRRRMSQHLRLDRELGLADLLQGRASVRSAARPDPRFNVSVLPAGLSASPRAEATAKRALTQTFEEARRYGRIVVEGGEFDDLAARLGLYELADEMVVLAPQGGARSQEIEEAVEELRRGRIEARVMYLPWSATEAA